MAITLLASALLFDMDGTIVDSTAVVEHAWAVRCQRHGLDLTEVLHYSHGRPTLATMNHFGQRIAPGRDWTAEADQMQQMESAQAELTKPIPGAIELIAQLAHHQWAVVTSAPRNLAEARIQAAGLPLPRILVPADEITNGKPHPEGYLKAAAALNVNPGNCIVFEDTPPGIDAGIGAGMQVIGMLTTVEPGRLSTANLIRDYFDLNVTSFGGQLQIQIRR